MNLALVIIRQVITCLSRHVTQLVTLCASFLPLFNKNAWNLLTWVWVLCFGGGQSRCCWSQYPLVVASCNLSRSHTAVHPAVWIDEMRQPISAGTETYLLGVLNHNDTQHNKVQQGQNSAGSCCTRQRTKDPFVLGAGLQFRAVAIVIVRHCLSAALTCLKCLCIYFVITSLQADVLKDVDITALKKA